MSMSAEARVGHGCIYKLQDQSDFDGVAWAEEGLVHAQTKTAWVEVGKGGIPSQAFQMPFQARYMSGNTGNPSTSFFVSLFRVATKRPSSCSYFSIAKCISEAVRSFK
jgi:hypothetical protein